MFWTNPSVLKTVFPWILWKGSPESADVFLTFDDGPHPEHTSRVLDRLAAGKVRASFFLNGKNALLHPALVERIRREGHSIGNHGQSHCRLDWKKPAFIRSEIESADRVIERAAGSKPVFFRPPYGRFDPRFRGLMREYGHRMVMWSLLSGDFLQTSPEALVGRIWKFMHPGAVVVLHDGHENAPAMIEALPELLRKLKAGGYVCKPLDEL